MKLIIPQGQTHELSLESLGMYKGAEVALQPKTIYGLKMLAGVTDPHERVDPYRSPHLGITNNTRGLTRLKPDEKGLIGGMEVPVLRGLIAGLDAKLKVIPEKLTMDVQKYGAAKIKAHNSQLQTVIDKKLALSDVVVPAWLRTWRVYYPGLVFEEIRINRNGTLVLSGDTLRLFVTDLLVGHGAKIIQKASKLYLQVLGRTAPIS